ncbi:MAG: sugar ABC transporter permease, partial [Sphaerochaetaceae bacterium]|nr:sugar ABC transporter permease [Sphaerochaetaceae bacterium]
MKQIQRNRVNRIDRNYLLFSLPGFLFFFSIVLIPFFIGVVLSFTEWNGVSSSLPFIGVENYQKLFTRDIPSLNSLFFTFRFTITVVIVSNLVGIALALAITALVKGGGLYRVIFFLPNVIGGLILGFIWRFILINGLPSLSEVLSLPFLSTPWLGDPTTGFWGLVIVYVWKTAGYLMVIYIASLYSIDSAVIESAIIDGASYWKMLSAIRFPLIMPA